MKNTLVVILVLAVVPVFADWDPPESGCTASDLADIYFFDLDKGWTVGDGGTVCATTDGGRNWIVQQDETHPYHLHDLHFTSGSIGWAVGTSGHLLHTTDGGAFWYDTTITASDLNALHFVDTDFGVAVGDGGLFLYTTDGGGSWIERTISPADLYDVHFLNRSLGWCTSRGDIGRTTDGGRNWDFVHPTFQIVYGISFPDSLNGWACGDSGIICQTTDGGRTWSCTTITSGVLSGVHFVHPDRGWTVGANGMILHTFDGGTIWNQEVSGVGDDLLGVFFLDRHHAWACGEAGTILIGTGTAVEESSIPSQGCEFHYSPGPVPGQTHFILPVGTLGIHDRTGRLLWELTTDSPTEITWDGRDSSGRPVVSGVYFFTFREGHNVSVGKTIIIR